MSKMSNKIDFQPKLFELFRNYSKADFSTDLMAGIIVGIVALPLAIAFGIASGVTPEKGIITAIVAGFIISFLGGSKVQIGGPTGAFIVIIYGIIQEYGIEGLTVATLMAGILLVLMGVFKLGAVIKFIPYPIIVGFTSGIAVTIFTTQIADVFGLTFDGEKVPGDFIGKMGVERSYEKQLRGEKGMEVLLRDVHGRIKGRYMNGAFDSQPEPGHNLKLGIDINLQALGERLMQGKIGSIVAIEPATGEILCMVSSPSYDPRLMVGRDRGKNHKMLSKDPRKPLLNRAISGQYPPGSTFKPTQALTFLQEGLITAGTQFPCHHGFRYGRFFQRCHGHASPISLIPALATSCNAYFSQGFFRMMSARRRYGNVQNAMTRWKDYMVSMGYGYALGTDLPGERRGMIPNAAYYDKHYGRRWNGITVVSDAIGQGEVNATPLQIANLAATIANRGYFITPHVVSKIEGGEIDSLYRTKRYTMVERKYYEYIVAGMRRAVLNGTCRAANLPGVEVCGKTGTAENKGHDHSAFIGFAPMDSPRIAIAVYVENGGFGAHFGVPIGSLMIEQYLNGKLSEESEKKAETFQNKHISYGDDER